MEISQCCGCLCWQIEFGWVSSLSCLWHREWGRKTESQSNSLLISRWQTHHSLGVSVYSFPQERRLSKRRILLEQKDFFWQSFFHQWLLKNVHTVCTETYITNHIVIVVYILHVLTLCESLHRMRSWARASHCNGLKSGDVSSSRSMLHHVLTVSKSPGASL